MWAKLLQAMERGVRFNQRSYDRVPDGVRYQLMRSWNMANDEGPRKTKLEILQQYLFGIRRKLLFVVMPGYVQLLLMGLLAFGLGLYHVNHPTAVLYFVMLF